MVTKMVQKILICVALKWGVLVSIFITLISKRTRKAEASKITMKD